MIRRQPRRSTARTRTNCSSAARSPAAATSSRSRPSSGSRSTPTGRATGRPTGAARTSGAPARGRSNGSTPITSTSSTSTGSIRTYRSRRPSVQERALQENLELADRVTALAERRGITPAQLALAWVMAKGEDIVPIPGTKSPRRLEENAVAAEIRLSAEDVEELDNAITPEAVRGDRYPGEMMALLNN